jgi:hypothetical protein
MAHAIITLYQCEHYGHPLLHGRQLKYLPPELLPLAEKWMSVRGTHAVKSRKNVARSEECRRKQSEAHIADWAVNLRRAEIVSAKMTETNSKKKPCPKCGLLMNAGNLTKHMKGRNCQG